MAISLELTPQQQTLLCQQSPVFHVKLSNSGAQEVTVRKTSMDQSLPLVHLLNLTTGQERDYQRPAARHDPGLSLSLRPRQSLGDSFSLLGITGELDPGEYEVGVTWKYGEGEKVKSSPARLKILPATPRSLCLVDAFGGKGLMKVGVWVNLAQEPYSLVRSSFTLQPGLTVSSKPLPIECKATCHPVLASPASQQALTSHWIAWIDNQELAYVHASDELGVSKPQRVSLPVLDAKIVEPLYGESASDPRQRGAGAALLCYREQNQFALQVIELGAKAVPGEVVRLASSPPAWMQSHVRSTGERLVTCAQAADGRVSLTTRYWPGSARTQPLPPTWAEWPGRFLGAGAAMDLENGLRGACLIQQDAGEGETKLVLISWQISARNEFKLTGKSEIPWHPRPAVKESVIRISDGGLVAVLLRDEQSTWHLYDGQGEPASLPPLYAKTPLPVDLGFLRGGSQPLLICGRLRSGFAVIHPDGSPLPLFHVEND